MQSILFVSRNVPGHRAIGCDTRLVRVLRWLAESGRAVHYVCLTRRLLPPRPSRKIRGMLASYQTLSVAGCRTNDPQPAPWQRLTRPRRLIGSLGARADLWVRLQAILEMTAARVLWVDHSTMAPVAAGLPPRPDVLRVIDTHDIMYLRDESFLAQGLAPQNHVTRGDERELLLPFDVIAAIQEQEERALAELLPERTIVTLGHAIDVNPQPSSTQDLCFVGSPSAANEASLLEFIEQAWPAIGQRCALARLQVVGGVCHNRRVMQAAASDPRILLRGVVRDVAEIYAGPAVVICPLWAGSGLKIKLVEALAHGKAIVATPVAAQGMEEAAGRAFLIADQPADFVEPVLTLLSEATRRAQLERSAAELARQRFGAANVWRAMDQILNSSNVIHDSAAAA